MGVVFRCISLSFGGVTIIPGVGPAEFIAVANRSHTLLLTALKHFLPTFSCRVVYP